MPAKTAEKKLLFPALAVLFALSAAALLLPLPGTGTAEIRFDFDCRAAAALGDGFAAAHAAGVSIYSADGEVLFALNEPVSADTLCSDGALGAVLCGDELLLFTGGGPAGRIALPGPFLGVYCTGGYVALVTECAGYDCLVSVYAGDRPLFRRYIAHGVCRGAVLADGALALAAGSRLTALEPETGAVLWSAELSGTAAGLYPAAGGFCAESGAALEFFSADGAARGVYSGGFSQLCSAGDSIYAVSGRRLWRIASDGEAEGGIQLPANEPLRLGGGSECCVIAGEQVLRFSSRLEQDTYSGFKYIPNAAFVTENGGLAVIWPRAAEIHRK